MIEYDVQIFIMHWKTGRHPAQSITHSKNCNDLCQGGYVFIIVCLFVSNFAQKLPNGFASNFQGRLAMDQWTNDEILVAIRIMDPDSDPYRDTGKTWLGRGMHCPSASS